MDIAQKSSLRILFLLNLLYDNEFSKNEIIEEFSKNEIEIKRTSINNYIEKLKSYGFPIITRQVKNTNYYSLDKNENVFLKQEELDASNDIKKILIEQKNPQIIKEAMRVFYKFALHSKNKNTRKELVNFDYYSKINWLLVKQLKQHCKNKDIIMIDYILSNGENKCLTIHTDTIKIGDWSNRLYLSGILNGDKKLSQLPIDKILTVKKIIKENVRIDLEVNVLVYKTSEDMYNNAGPDKKEGISEIKNGIVTIKRPIDDVFFTLQRLLYFCPDLFFISDNKIKNLIKEKLFALKDMYGC